MLYQKGVFDIDTLKALSKARKARNDLAHRGVHPSESDANVSYAGLLITDLRRAGKRDAAVIRARFGKSRNFRPFRAPEA